MNGISKLLSTDGFIQVNKSLIKKLGLHEAIIIGELCAEYNYWEQRGKLEDNMFYSTRENIEENTGLNEHYQRKALKTLQDAEIISVKRKGIPAVNYYKIDFDKILILLSTRSERDEDQEIDVINLNNNKQTKIKEQKNNSKELLQNSPEFDFGKQKPKKDNLFTKCVSLIDDFVTTHDCDNSVRRKLIMYLNFRLSITDKPLYVNTWKGILNKLAKLCDDTQTYESVINQSIERGYLSFYPINDKSYKSYCNKLADKPWEKGVRSDTYTEEELEELNRIDREREAKGLRTKF